MHNNGNYSWAASVGSSTPAQAYFTKAASETEQLQTNVLLQIRLMPTVTAVRTVYWLLPKKHTSGRSLTHLVCWAARCTIFPVEVCIIVSVVVVVHGLRNSCC